MGSSSTKNILNILGIIKLMKPIKLKEPLKSKKIHEKTREKYPD